MPPVATAFFLDLKGGAAPPVATAFFLNLKGGAVTPVAGHTHCHSYLVWGKIQPLQCNAMH